MSSEEEYSFSSPPFGDSDVSGGMEHTTMYILVGLVILVIVLVFIYMRKDTKEEAKKEGMIDPLLPMQIGRGFNVPNDMGYAGPVSEIAALEKSKTTSFGPITF